MKSKEVIKKVLKWFTLLPGIGMIAQIVLNIIKGIKEVQK